MAHQPASPTTLIEAFGPHVAFPTGQRLDRGVEADRLVKTHCCFCGQQCGIQLKVKDNEVIGFEPWEEFPFNRGMLCPKGVKRYLQGSHPDRLLHAYRRDTTAPNGFSAMSYDEAIRTVAQNFARIQSEYGPSSVAVLSGASLTTEKTYLMGKFARMCLKTSNIDYNGRLCMVSAGAGNKKAFGVDRAANPWSDITKADVVWISGANIAECAPITTSYVWQAREFGAKVIVVDPRITPIARTCDLFLPVKPGRDVALFNGILHLMIEHDWVDHAFIEEHTVGFDAVAQHVRDWTPRRTAEVTGIAEKSIRHAAEWWGTAKSSFLLHARGIEHHSHGVQNVLGAINIVLASGRIGREDCGYATITGQANGQGGREHGQKCDQLPGARDLANPEHRAHVARVWGIEPDELPQPGVDAFEIFRRIERDEIRGLLSICFNPVVSLPDNNFVARMLEKLDFFVAIDFFLNDTARYADIVLPGSLHEEDEGTVTQIEGRVIKINKAVDPPGDARQDWRIIQDIAAAMGRSRGFTFTEPRQIFDELRRASQGGVADYSGITYEKIEQQYGICWPCPSEDHPGTLRLFEPNSWNPIAKGAGPFYFPDGKARFNVAEYRPPAEEIDAEYPIILTTGRVISQFLSGTQTRRIGPLVDQYPEPRVEIHPKLAAQYGVVNDAWITVESRRGSCTLRAEVVRTIRPDTVFVPYHWAGPKSINQLTISAQDPISKIPEYKVCAVRIRKADGPPAYTRERGATAIEGSLVQMHSQKFFFIDPNRCIGCKACVEACSECDTHKGHSMIHLEVVDRSASPQTVPVVCMHCDTPTCAEVCPADAIKRTADGVVQTARKPRCIACNNCVLACPFGVPKMNSGFELMMKCDMCYDRTSIGKMPMCATVCPSRALHYGTWEEIEQQRPRSVPQNTFLFGHQTVKTKVYMMVPRDAQPEAIDVMSALHDRRALQLVTLSVPGNANPMLDNLFVD